MSMAQFPFKVKTNVSWAGEEEGDLGFIENEIIEVYSYVDESWWCGRLIRNNAEGIFPKEYVEILESSLSKSNSNRSILKNSNSQNKLSWNEARNDLPSPQAEIVSRTSADHFADNGRCGFRNGYIAPYERNESPKSTHGFSSRANSAQSTPRKKNMNDEELKIRDQEIRKFRLLKEKEYHVKPFQNVSPKPSNRNSMINLTAANPVSHIAYKSSDRKGKRTKEQNEFEQEFSTPKEQAFHLSYIGSGNYSPTSDDAKAFLDKTNRLNGKIASSNSERDILHLEPESIYLKRKQLEQELYNLKQLEKIAQKNNSRSPSEEGKTRRRNSLDQVDTISISSSSKLPQDYVFVSQISSDGTSHKMDDIGEVTPDSEHDLEIPPPPPKHGTPRRQINYSVEPKSAKLKDEVMSSELPYDASDVLSGSKKSDKIKLDEEDLLMLSQMEINDLKNSLNSMQSDVLNLSELSATSAGSFMRHKNEKLLRGEESDIRNTEIKYENNEVLNKSVMDSIFQDRKSRHPNIFKKFLLKKDEKGVNAIEKKLQDEDQTSWIDMKVDLNRMSSLSSHEKQQRSKREVRAEPGLILRPLDYISDINTAETTEGYEGEIDFDLIPYSKIDIFVKNYPVDCHPNEFLEDINVKFNSSKVSQVRAILLHVCKFNLIPETGAISKLKPNVRDMISKKEGSIFQINYLFKKYLDALKIPNEIVYGFWKKPNEFYHDEKYIINHCWLSIFLEHQFVLMDLLSFKQSSICNINDSATGFNEFYFLTSPKKLISTHIPSIIDLQHVIPPIDQNIVFYLPRNYSGFYRNKLAYKNFNNALTRLKNLEFFELELYLPRDVELFALVKTANTTTNEVCSCQVYWYCNKRIARVKAILPKSQNVGVLQIFAGPKGLQKHFENIHELAISIPLSHSGTWRDFKFVPRYPTLQSSKYDIYVKSPQIGKLMLRSTYNFEILSHPSDGINAVNRLHEKSFKLVIESPSGKYYHLEKHDRSELFGSYRFQIKSNEIGNYRGLVLGDSGHSWHVFAQWECIPSAVSD